MKAVKNNSGWSWSDEHGADIDAESEGTWNAYVQLNPQAAPFRNAGWVYWDAVDRLMPQKDRGAHVYRASLEVLDGLQLEIDDEVEIVEKNTLSVPIAVPEVKKEEVSIPSVPPSVPPTPVAGMKRLSSSKTPGSNKKPRVTAGQEALYGMKESMSGLGTVLAQYMAATLAPPATPGSTSRVLLAVQKVQELDKWMTPDQVADMMDVFEKSNAACDIYLGLTDDSMRKRWILKKVNAWDINYPEVD